MFNIRIPVLTFSLALLEEDIAYLEVLNNDIADDVGFLTITKLNYSLTLPHPQRENAPTYKPGVLAI